MVLRYRDEHRLVAGSHPLTECAGLFLVLLGILASVLFILMPDEVADVFGYDVGFPIVCVVAGAWIAFFEPILEIDMRRETVCRRSLWGDGMTWTFDQILRIDLRPASFVPGTLSLWGLLFQLKTGGELRMPISRARHVFNLFAAAAYRTRLEIFLNFPEIVRDTAQDLLQTDPRNIELRWVLALAHAQLRAHRLAADELKRALEVAPGEYTLRRDYARYLCAGFQFEAALGPVRRCIAEKPDDMVAVLILSAALRELGREDEAFAVLDEAYPRSKDVESVLHLVYADASAERGELEKSAAAAERVVSRLRKISRVGSIPNPDELMTRAVAFSRLKRFEEADRDFAGALRVAHMAPEIYSEYADYLVYRAGVPGQEREELESRALDHFEKAHASGKIFPADLLDRAWDGLRENPRYRKVYAEVLGRMDPASAAAISTRPSRSPRSPMPSPPPLPVDPASAPPAADAANGHR